MIDILRPSANATTKAKASARPLSPSASPASSTSTLKASSSSRSRSRSDSLKPNTKPSFAATARSKGQQARRYSIESGVSASNRYRAAALLESDPETTLALNTSSNSRPSKSLYRRHQHGQTVLSHPSPPSHDSHKKRKKKPKKPYKAQKPLLGGLYFSDLVVVAFFYAVNLIRTCGLAELIDVAFKGLTYALTRLPFDFYQRWSLSRSAPPFSYSPSRPAHNASTPSPILSGRRSAPVPVIRRSSSSDPASSSQPTSSPFTTSDEETTDTDDGDGQLSPFHHLVILLVRFACTSFPHLIPRVLFAEETIGPLVRWRTGGGAAGIVREFTSESGQPHQPTTAQEASEPLPSEKQAQPPFRAFWIGADAHVPIEVRRSDQSARTATTLLYLHGGGFSLGSVAFYAEALIRIVTKICRLEDRDNDARCVAVEYDLGPTSRFPGPLLQCLRCYAHLIEVEGIDPSCITIAGDSAGGNLAMAMLLCLDGQAKQEPGLAERDWSRLPFPGRAVLISPWADLRPSASIAFAPLRNPAMHQHKRAASSSGAGRIGSHVSGSGKEAPSKTSAWTEAMAHYEWDYVASEALMHFAQLYSGVLETPRRVRGPMGWVANLCAIIAGDEIPADSSVARSTFSKTMPLNILRTLTSPPRRLARAAHSILTEPLLDRQSSSVASSKTNADAFNDLQRVHPLSIGAMDPIFPSEDRKTDAVPATSDLYIPIWNQDRVDEITKQDRQFQAAIDRLESNRFINPSLGDWSRIRLQKGMLVMWGERERLADDIEVWVESVREAQRYPKDAARSTAIPRDRSDLSGAYDRPCQDQDPGSDKIGSGPMHRTGGSIQERRAASRSPIRQSEPLPSGEWICTAVEHGPGGVHAWPFVSMYLAGSDFEREKGLEIIASFIAQPYSTPHSTNPNTPLSEPRAALSVKLPAYGDERGLLGPNSPPHLNAVSPAGSMPSDVSLQEDEGERDYRFHAPSQDGSEDWNSENPNELGLEGVYPHETIWPEPTPTPTPSTGMGTPLEESDSEQNHADLADRIGLGLAHASRNIAREFERGGSQESFMEPVHLHHIAHGGRSASYDTVRARHSSEGRSSIPDAWRSASTEANVASFSSNYDSTFGYGSLSGGGGGRSLAELEALEAAEVEAGASSAPANQHSPSWQEGEVDDEATHQAMEDFAPSRSSDHYYHPSPYSAMRYSDDDVTMDVGYYGLHNYTTLRPEGLSDIAEEESQIETSSVLSSGAGASGGRSPPFSDEDVLSPIGGSSPNLAGRRINPGRYGAAYTPSAAEMARLREALQERERQYQHRFARGVHSERGAPTDNDELARTGEHLRERFPIEDDDDSGNDDDADADTPSHGARGREIGKEGRNAGDDGREGWRSSTESSRIGGSAEAGAQLSIQAGLPIFSTSNSNLLAPPSPARSNSSQTSSAKDVWW